MYINKFAKEPEMLFVAENHFYHIEVPSKTGTLLVLVAPILKVFKNLLFM